MLIEATLVLAAAVAGLTGTWSPCGFSMIETIGPVGHRSGRPTTLAASATFTAGALAGGMITFGALAALGALVHGAGGELAYAVAAVLAVAAAILEVRATPIVPQVRRQLPEHWRRLMPMPLAAGLYGVLLGLGFTTFVLTFGVFALAGIVVAVGEPVTGLLVGLAFGAGRALPVALIAPVADRPAGIRLTELMANRPEILRGFRAADAAALLACAVALAVTVPAGAAKIEHSPAADPAVAGDDFAFQRPDRSAAILLSGREVNLPGIDPALGDGRIAVIRGDEIAVLGTDLTELGRVRAPAADAVAVSGRWLVWRARTGGRDLMRARRLANSAVPGPELALGRAGGGDQLGRPSLDGNRLVYARASDRENVIVRRVLGSNGKKQAKATLVRSRTVGLSNPSIHGERLLYVRHTPAADRLKLTSVGGSGAGRTLLSRRNGTLWSTAVSADRAYVTQISGSAPQQRILSVAR